MNPTAALFYSIGEPYAAGLFEEPERSYFYRHALGLARYYEALRPAPYEGERLYPAKGKNRDDTYAVQPHYVMVYWVNWELLESKSREAAAILRNFHDVSHKPSGWYHAAPHYRRIVREGLDSYRERICKSPGDEDFREGLLALLDGMRSYLERSAAYLEQAGAPRRLVDAVRKVPFAPADTYFEGLAAWNLIMYFDGVDNLGRLDEGLAHLYRGEDLTDAIEELYINLDWHGSWSCTIGSEYNAITEQALRASRGHRRPMLELMVREDMPEHLWELSADLVRSGSCNPGFYSEDGIFNMLKKSYPWLRDEDIRRFCGCGCTETNLEGLTYAGGTDGAIPLLTHFESWMNSHLVKSATFEEFYEGVCTYTEAKINEHLDVVVDRYIYKSKYLPHPMRTLLFDDCIDKGLDFHAGGARYTWTGNSQSGLINVIDSLIAVRELVYRKKLYTAEEFLEKLHAEDAVLYAQLKKCPHYGVDDEDADALGAAYAQRVYAVYRNRPKYAFIDAYVPMEHQFDRYEWAGLLAGPTPDGRHAYQPTCDSIAALRGKASAGPTAMLKSASKLPMAEGISVLNLTLAKNFVDKSLAALVKSYFALGGVQVQVTYTSTEELQDALANPEKYPDLLVRVGGYSEYFKNLTDTLRRAVVERDVHELG